MSGPVQPDCVTFDVKEREAFLSQIGNFTPIERELFHRICKMWGAEISYATVLNIAASESVSAKNDIDSLMKKLKAAHAGLLTTAMQDGNRVPQWIILTNPDDYYFYHKLVEEELMDVVSDLSLKLPSIETLSEKGIQVPPDYMSDLSYEELARLQAEKEVKDYRIFRIEAKGGKLLVSSYNVRRFITVALAKMQAYLQNSNLLSIIAGLKNMAMMDLKKQVEGKEPAFWVQLCHDVLENQDAIRQVRKLTLEEHFWTVADFLNKVIRKQIEEIRKRKDAEAERVLDMRTILEQARSVPGHVLNEDAFNQHLLSFKVKYGDSFGDFKQEFETKMLEAPDRKALPALVHLARAYIHQDNVHAFFLLTIDRLGKELFSDYVRTMEHYLKHPRESQTQAFYSKENFESDIAERVKTANPLMNELLQRPNLVAEAIILSARRHKDVKNTDDLKANLTPFFFPDKIKFRDYSVIMGLNIMDIFKYAFLKLSVLRQIILRVGGKKESFQKKFEGFVEGNYGISATTDKASTETMPELAEPRRHKPGMSVSPRPQESAKIPGKSAPAAKTVSSAPPKIDKNYSRQEQEKAWKEFQKTIKK